MPDLTGGSGAEPRSTRHIALMSSGGLQRRLRSFVSTYAVGIALVLVVRVTLAEPYHIPSGSMQPALLVGDWLFVNKLIYGPHITSAQPSHDRKAGDSRQAWIPSRDLCPLHEGP